MKFIRIFLLILIIIGIGLLLARNLWVPKLVDAIIAHENASSPSNTTAINSFEECAAAGNPIMESYPRKCATKDGKNFTENIGNTLDKNDFIRVTSPKINAEVSSPITVTGEARGNWYFEASFPVVLVDWNGKVVAQGIAQAQGDWMTTNFVPFKTTLILKKSDVTAPYSNKAKLILKKDNPSGLPEKEDSLEVPVFIK